MHWLCCCCIAQEILVWFSLDYFIILECILWDTNTFFLLSPPLSFPSSAPLCLQWWLSAPRMHYWALANSKTHLGVSSHLMNDPAAGGRIDTRSVCLRVHAPQHVGGLWDERARSAELEIPLICAVRPGIIWSMSVNKAYRRIFPLFRLLPQFKLNCRILLVYFSPYSCNVVQVFIGRRA